MPSQAFTPKKSLGQNFLIDAVHQARIVAAADLTSYDVVLEIGPGYGALTDLLAAQAKRVLAVELDDRLIPLLRERFGSQSHVTVVHGDILELNLRELMGVPLANGTGLRYKVVANLPYYITAAAIRHLLESDLPPNLLVLTVQREVAERIVASPPNMSLLALSVQFYCTAQIVDRIPAGAFRPIPKVDSAVVRMVRREEAPVPDVSATSFFRTARAGFCQPRKQLRNSLAAGLGVTAHNASQWLVAANIIPQRRAETLSLPEWGRLAGVIAESRALCGEANLRVV